MIPRYSLYDVMNGLNADAVVSGKHRQAHCSWNVAPSNLFHIAHCKFSVVAFLAKIIALFRHHVPHVFPVTSEPEVIRIDARRVVTSVTNKCIGRNRTFKNKPRDSMRSVLATGSFRMKVSVTKMIASLVPYPATGWQLGKIQQKVLSHFIKCSRSATRHVGSVWLTNKIESFWHNEKSHAPSGCRGHAERPNTERAAKFEVSCIKWPTTAVSDLIRSLSSVNLEGATG